MVGIIQKLYELEMKLKMRTMDTNNIQPCALLRSILFIPNILIESNAGSRTSFMSFEKGILVEWAF